MRRVDRGRGARVARLRLTGDHGQWCVAAVYARDRYMLTRLVCGAL